MRIFLIVSMLIFLSGCAHRGARVWLDDEQADKHFRSVQFAEWYRKAAGGL